MLAIGGAATGWAVGGLLDDPAVRAGGVPEPSGPETTSGTRILLSEGDVQRLLAEHVAGTLGVPAVRVVAGLPGDGLIEAGVGVPARALVESAAGSLGRRLPSGWLARPVWLVLTFRPRLAPAPKGGRLYAELDVVQFRMGSRRLPVSALALLVGPARSALRWPLPRGVVGLTVERGRVILSRGS